MHRFNVRLHHRLPCPRIETELKIAPPLSFALDCWVLGLPDRGSIFIRPPTEIWHRLSPLYPTSGPPSLLSLLSTLISLSPLAFPLSLSLSLSLSLLSVSLMC